MSKSFTIFTLICILTLGVFVYFVFGLNQKSSNTTSTINVTTQTQPSETNQKIPTDLKSEDIKVGTGAAVKNGDIVVVNYVGILADGTKFDSSYDRNEPFTTQIGTGQVIKGWDLGIIGMKIDGKRKLTIPPSLGYGDQATGSIPPNSTLIFEVELVAIQ